MTGTLTLTLKPTSSNVLACSSRIGPFTTKIAFSFYINNKFLITRNCDFAWCVRHDAFSDFPDAVGSQVGLLHHLVIAAGMHTQGRHLSDISWVLKPEACKDLIDCTYSVQPIWRRDLEVEVSLDLQSFETSSLGWNLVAFNKTLQPFLNDRS